MMKVFILFIGALTLFVGGALVFNATAAAKSQTINVIKFDGNSIPEEFYKPPAVEKLPLPMNEIIKMKKGGVDEEVIVDAIEKRGIIGGSDADAMILLKKSGFSKRVLKAVSRYALPKNRSIDLELVLEFDRPSRKADPRYLYIIINDNGYDRILHADLGKILKGKWRYDDLIDSRDPLLKRRIRVVRFFGNLLLKHHGKISAEVILSKKPNISEASELSDKERRSAKALVFQYPDYSLMNDCRMKLEFKRNPVLDHKWKIKSSSMRCEFN